jgi:hypothetical protein
VLRVFACEGGTEGDKELESLSIYDVNDKMVLSEYQCLLRRQIEIFETGPNGVGVDVQGQVNAIRLGQVGIRCRHCASLTNKTRAIGGVYYSKTIRGLYQLAQNMARGHLEKNCKMVGAPICAKLAKLRQSSKKSGWGTNEYWSKRWWVMSVYEKGAAYERRSIEKKIVCIVN